MMELTQSVTTVAQFIHTLLQNNKAALGLADVWFGDQSKLPRTPAATVEPGPKTRELNGAPFRVRAAMEVYIMLYMEKIRDNQANEVNIDQIAESVENLLHDNNGLDGLVIKGGFVTSMEPGYATRGGTLMRAVRLTYSCQSVTNLPM